MQAAPLDFVGHAPKEAGNERRAGGAAGRKAPDDRFRPAGSRDDQFGAHGQGQERRHRRDVVQGQDAEIHVVVGELHGTLVDGDAREQGPMRQEHAFGQVGRAARVQKKGAVVRGHAGSLAHGIGGFGERLVVFHASVRPRAAAGAASLVADCQYLQRPAFLPRAGGQGGAQAFGHQGHPRARACEQPCDHGGGKPHVVLFAHRSQSGAGEGRLDGGG